MRGKKLGNTIYLSLSLFIYFTAVADGMGWCVDRLTGVEK
jgi:hypothetical protein